MADKPEVISTVEARGGVTPHIVRYVLIVSLVLAVGAMIWIFAVAPRSSQQGATTEEVRPGVTTREPVQ